VQVAVLGQTAVPQTNTVALFCSAQAPAGVLRAVHDLAQGWRREERLILSGFHSPVEQEALAVLLRDPGQAILCLARSLSQQMKPEWREAPADGRLWIASPFGETVRRATRETARARNRFVATLADTVLFAHARPGTMTFDLAREALGWEKRVLTIDHEANRPLLDLGARPYPDGIG
jgi:predicted Rossmann fold nucleotide-binding protein DprA/Smf involved in DNA uptake